MNLTDHDTVTGLVNAKTNTLHKRTQDRTHRKTVCGA